MYSSRLFQLAVLVVAVFSFAQASWWNNFYVHPRGLVQRQTDTGGNSPSDVLPTDALPTPSGPPDEGDPEEGDSTTDAPTDEETSVPVETSVAEITTTEQVTEAVPTTSSVIEEATTTAIVEETTTQEEEVPTTTSAPDESTETTTYEAVVSTSIEIVTKTNSDGTKQTSTTISKTTTTPDLNSNGDNGTSGLSTKNRNTIIGVVVGVGGAIVLGALALVAWRIWGRKKRAEENDGLMDFNYQNDIGGAEKSEPPSSAGAPARSPFQSTLENHHQPTQVNASSNF